MPLFFVSGFNACGVSMPTVFRVSSASPFLSFWFNFVEGFAVSWFGLADLLSNSLAVSKADSQTA